MAPMCHGGFPLVCLGKVVHLNKINLVYLQAL